MYKLSIVMNDDHTEREEPLSGPGSNVTLNQRRIYEIRIPNTLLSILNLDYPEDLIDNIIDGEESKEIITPMCKDFRSKLVQRSITDEDIETGLTCAICQEGFIKEERLIELPCKEGPHFFHDNESSIDACPGINPWIDEKNTCPICRTIFPKEPEPEPEPEPDTEPELPDSLIPTSNTTLDQMQMEGIGLLRNNIPQGTIQPEPEPENNSNDELINNTPLPPIRINPLTLSSLIQNREVSMNNSVGEEDNNGQEIFNSFINNIFSDIYQQRDDEIMNEVIQRSIEDQ